MELTQRELMDLRYLREFYGWNDKDAREVMVSIRSTEHAARYYTILAAAHRAGYEQNAENGFVRLQAWCALKGLPDPFGKEFDIGALDAMEFEQRGAAA